MTQIEAPSGKNESTENFPVARLIRTDLRHHVTAYYVFARAADDISDDPLLDGHEKCRRLDLMGTNLSQADQGEVSSCTLLKQSLSHTKVDPAHALDLLTAFKRDTHKLRYQNWEELLDYCRYSANPVGRYLLDLHGVDRASWKAGDALCTALQILNHIQDCADDYRELDRVYLPLDIMARYKIDPTALSAERSSEGLRQTIDALLDLTHPLIVEARKLPAQINDPMLRFNTSVIIVVAEKLEKLLRRRDPLCENVKLSKLSKICALIKGGLRSVFCP